MPGPIFWVITALFAVLLCSAHLCAGIWIGREFFGRKLVRQAKAALISGMMQSQSQQGAADTLLKRTERLAALSRRTPLGDALATDLAAIREAATSLCEAMKTNAEAYRDALVRLPEEGVASDEQWACAKNRIAEPRHTKQVNSSDAPPASTAVENGRDELPPWSSLSAKEVERFRTGFLSGRDTERRETRYPYGVAQFVAPVQGSSFPQSSEFFQVMCREVSCQGISYFSTEPPDSEEVIVTLGGTPDLTFICARITRSHASNLDGEAGYTVNCEFVARLAPGIYCWNESTNSIGTPTLECALEVCE